MKHYTPTPMGVGRRPRRRRRGISDAGDRRAGRWGPAVAGIVILAGVSVAITEPAEGTAPDRLSVLQEMLNANGAAGMRVGAAVLTPSIDFKESFDSNVFATAKGARSDFYTSILPALDVEIDQAPYAVAVRAQGELREYAGFSRENVGNGAIEATSRLDIAPNAHLVAGLGYALLHEDRGALVPFNGVGPTQFAVGSAKAGFVVDPAPLGFRLDASAQSYAYNDVMLAGGAVGRETGRDRVVYALEPRLSYRILPGYDAFLRGGVNRRQYNSTRLADGLQRSSTGYAADLGIALGLPGFAAGEVYLGFTGQSYDASAAKPIRAVDFGGNFEWRPMPATSFRVNLSRSIEDAALPGLRGYVQTAARLGLEQELVRRLLLLGSVGYIKADFAGAALNSNLYEAMLETRYMLSANLSAGLAYALQHRASDATLPNYTRHIVEVRLRGQL